MDNIPEPINEPQVSAPYTAWHYLLVQTLQALIAPHLLKILPFDKLGTLPIEADVTLLLQELDGPALARLVPDFDFMLRGLRPVTVVEYKAPEDVLSIDNVETAICYALLARRKHKVSSAEEVALQFMYSYCAKDLLDHFQRVGLPFAPVEEGVLRGQVLGIQVSLINLVKLADRRPADLLNLLSARHRRFVLSSDEQDRRAAIVRNLYYNVFKEVKRMLTEKKLEGLPGASDVLKDMDELNRRMLASFSPEERLRDLSLEDRLRDLSPEERLRGLSSQQRAQLLNLLLHQG